LSRRNLILIFLSTGHVSGVILTLVGFGAARPAQRQAFAMFLVGSATKPWPSLCSLLFRATRIRGMADAVGMMNRPPQAPAGHGGSSSRRPFSASLAGSGASDPSAAVAGAEIEMA
jgi:hypothetical protein